MSRLIDTDPSYLSLGTAISVGYPFTVFCKFKVRSTTQQHRLFSIGDTAGTDNQFILSYVSNIAVVNAKDLAGGNRDSITTNNGNLNEWNTAVGVFASSTSRTVILNADFANKGTNTGLSNPLSLDNTVLGALVRSVINASGVNYEQAHTAVWNKVLSDDQITELHEATNPLDLIADGGGTGLISYWPLLGDHDPELNLETSGAGNSFHMSLVSAPAKADHFGQMLQTMQESFTDFRSSGAPPSGGASVDAYRITN